MCNINLGRLVLFVHLALIAGCQHLPEMNRSYLVGQTSRANGTFIEWTLGGAQEGSLRPILFVAQGSGCAPARANSNIALLATALPEFALLTIEKYGVMPADTPADPMSSCSTTYFEHHTVTQRVEDAKAVLQDLRARLLWDGRLVLFGGSEGGAVVSILSHELIDADAVVVFSTGTGLTMAEFFPMVVPPPVATQMSDVFEQVRSNPDARGVVGGNSFRWFADILDRRLSDDLLKSDIPVLIVHGQNDRHAPIATARAAREAFIGAGEADRLTYWELPHRDHQMVDEAGKPHLADILFDVASWIRGMQL